MSGRELLALRAVATASACMTSRIVIPVVRFVEPRPTRGLARDCSEYQKQLEPVVLTLQLLTDMDYRVAGAAGLPSQVVLGASLLWGNDIAHFVR